MNRKEYIKELESRKKDLLNNKCASTGAFNQVEEQLNNQKAIVEVPEILEVIYGIQKILKDKSAYLEFDDGKVVLTVKKESISTDVDDWDEIVRGVSQRTV